MACVLVADDHPLFRRAVVQAVREVAATATIREAATLAQTQAALAAGDIDLVLLDLNMPGSQGLFGLSALRASHPEVAVLLISAQEDVATIRRALLLGALGFVPKRAPPEQLAEAIAAVLACRGYLPDDLRAAVGARADRGEDEPVQRLAQLTGQQHRVLALVAEGRLNKQIADALGIQERTVKAHLTAIFERLGVRNRTQAGVLLRSLSPAIEGGGET